MTSLKRHFRVVINSKEHGLYVSSTPSSAARKVVSKLCADNKNRKVEFSIRETTKDSNKKIYGPYIGYMQKLDKPVELEGRVIKYKPIAKLNKKNQKMKGGNGTINGQGDDIYNVYYNLIVEQMNKYCKDTPYTMEKQYIQYSVNDYKYVGNREENRDFELKKYDIISKLKNQFGLEEIMKLMKESPEMKEVEKAISIYIKTFWGQTTKYDKSSCHDIFKYYFSKGNIYIDTSVLIETIDPAELIEIYKYTPQTYIELKYIVPVKAFINAGYTLEKLVDDGVPVKSLLKQGVKYDDLINTFSEEKLEQLNFLNDLKEFLYLRDKVKLVNTLSLKHLKKLKINLKDIIMYSNKQYSIQELINAGFDKKYISNTLLSLFASGKYKYGDIKKKINEIKESISSSSNQKNLDFFKSIEDRLNELKKDCPKKIYNFKYRTNPDCLYPDKLSINTS